MNMRKTIVAVALFALAGETWAAQVNSRGVPNAPIQIEVYSDYQCPACKLLYDRTLRPLISEYVDRGKVYLVHREFPLPMHAHALEAASYACAANRVGKYEQVCEVLFQKQQSWATDGKVEQTAASVLTPAEAKKVRALAKDPTVIAEVQEDIQAGRNAKVDSTPTMILTHRAKQYRIPTAAGYDILRRFLDQLLAN
jgi:protein-disulfide isomerase